MVALFVGALSGAYVLRYGLALPLFVTEACLPVHNRGVCGDRRDSGKSSRLLTALYFQLPLAQVPLAMGTARADSSDG
jgi:hypothetical protein